MKLVARLVRDDAGADLIEYAVLAGILALGTIAAVDGVGAGMQGVWGTIDGAIKSAAALFPK